jgi:hypothetical protein
LRMRLSPTVIEAREPLLVMGTTPGVLAIAFVRSVSKDQVIVGIQFTGLGVYESRPISLARENTVEVIVRGPSLLPDLGESGWGGIPYPEQLAELGQYSIAVNGVSILQINSLLDRPIDRDTPLSFGVNPAPNSAVSAVFSGRIIDHSRLEIGESPPAQ